MGRVWPQHGHRGRPFNSAVMRLSKVWALIATVATAVALSGCALLDRRSDIAYRTLVGENGAIDKPSYSAAISAKFPPGSSVEALRKYASESGGECHTRENGYWCEIAYLAGFCYAAMIGIEVKVKNSLVESTRVEIGGLGC